ncbi:hypothetical protein OS493_022180 [Desmophyllum pertusum]|uniref:Uncharacterized protein n=1 Tax=Desmophyllum pertusum TaxID=174260 RepID=A0A9W9YAT2_9CNID|nr:hypothetical protein OS493_022180 [Desmophyllum pertusum]
MVHCVVHGSLCDTCGSLCGTWYTVWYMVHCVVHRTLCGSLCCTWFTVRYMVHCEVHFSKHRKTVGYHFKHWPISTFPPERPLEAFNFVLSLGLVDHHQTCLP